MIRCEFWFRNVSLICDHPTTQHAKLRRIRRCGKDVQAGGRASSARTCDCILRSTFWLRNPQSRFCEAANAQLHTPCGVISMQNHNRRLLTGIRSALPPTSSFAYRNKRTGKFCSKSKVAIKRVLWAISSCSYTRSDFHDSLWTIIHERWY